MDLLWYSQKCIVVTKNASCKVETNFFPGTPVNFCNHLMANSPSFKSIETIQFDNATARHWNKERIFTHELLLMNLRVWVLSFEFEKQSDIWQMRNTGSLINSVCNSLHLLTLHFWGTVARPRMDSKRGKWKKNPLPCSNSERRVSFDKVTTELC